MSRLRPSLGLFLALHAVACVVERPSPGVDAGMGAAPELTPVAPVAPSDAASDAASAAPDALAPFDEDAGVEAAATDPVDSDRDAAIDEQLPGNGGGPPIDVPRPDPSVYRGACEIGIVRAGDPACFQPHDPEIAIPLVGANQGDLLIELALRARDARGAVADVVVTAKDSGRSVRTRVSTKDFVCGEDLVCGDLQDGRWCKALPVWAVSFTLVDDPYDLMDLPVTVEMTLLDADGPLCTTSIEGFLYRF